jgi:outer membrane protein assembly factor BamA
MGAEYSFPLYAESLRGLIFLDTGTVDGDRWRASIGAGVRMTIQLLGPLPLELSLGFPFSKDGEDEEQIFNFIIGGLF